jgi:hypothetical protein
MSFLVLPPEVNSARIYLGAGRAPAPCVTARAISGGPPTANLRPQALRRLRPLAGHIYEFWPTLFGPPLRIVDSSVRPRRG